MHEWSGKQRQNESRLQNKRRENRDIWLLKKSVNQHWKKIAKFSQKHEPILTDEKKKKQRQHMPKIIRDSFVPRFFVDCNDF